MIVAALFALLSAVALVGAGGVLVCRRTVRCALLFLLCCSALAGLYGLLDMHYVAAVQFVTCLYVTGLFLTLGASSRTARQHTSGALWYAAPAFVLLVVTTYAILRGALGESVLGALPIWAVPGEHLSSLGQELLGRYTILLAILALLLLAGIVASTYVLRQAYRAQPRGRPE